MNHKTSYFLLAVVILTALAFLLLMGRTPVAPARTSPDVSQSPKTMSVTGEGAVRVRPDQAVVTLGVQTEALTAREAQERAAQAIDQIVGKLTNLGVDRGDIQTSRLALEPPTSLDLKLVVIPAVHRFRSINQVSVTVRNLKNLGRIIDEAVAAGSNRIERVVFTLADPRVAQDQALSLAVKDARHKADQMALAAGISVRSLRSLSISGVNGLHRLEEAEGGTPGFERFNVPADLTIRVLVNATYEF